MYIFLNNFDRVSRNILFERFSFPARMIKGLMTLIEDNISCKLNFTKTLNNLYNLYNLDIERFSAELSRGL